MADISVNYMGLRLRSPFIAASSGLTSSIDNICEIEAAGFGAIVLKSLFEEQIVNETDFILRESEEFPGMTEYIERYIKANSVSNYLELIKSAKERVDIPIIASINCFNKGEWMEMAKNIENAGADALELNIFTLPLDISKGSDAMEREYRDIIKAVSSSLKIPVAVKIGRNFTNIPGFVDSLSSYGANGVVMFNKFYTPDIDIYKKEIISATPLSDPNDYITGLRWVALTSALVKNVDISASTGIHTPETAIKNILAGAKTVQLCSVLMREGIGVIAQFENFLRDYMRKEGYDNVETFRGLLNYKKINDPVSFERVQFMKTFGGAK